MREEGGSLRLEEAGAIPGSEDGLLDFSQPGEVARLELSSMRVVSGSVGCRHREEWAWSMIKISTRRSP